MKNEKVGVLLRMSLAFRPELQVIGDVLTSMVTPDSIGEFRSSLTIMKKNLSATYEQFGGERFTMTISALLRRHPDDVSRNEKVALETLRTTLRHLSEAKNEVRLALECVAEIEKEGPVRRALWE